ncbi:MAG: RNB domain-containing ribonuclease [Cyanobacteria bacterium WB6_1B_304]|jgi:ribonuclease R|nr:RNB domain-containing ribonuclease [Cyanobacteria bacterium WB6_1B_304]
MEFSIGALLANFADEKLIAPKVLEKKLGCLDEVSLRQLQITLDALERIGVLAKDHGRYRRVPEEGLVEGRLRCSSKGFCFAIQDEEGTDDVYIRECHLNTAWNGDRVLVRVTKDGSRRKSPEGEVRLILERANTSLLARVKREEEHYRAVPLDDRLLFELDLIDNGVDLEAAIDHLVSAEILRYPLGILPPLAQVSQVLGTDAETARDTDVVCCKHGLRLNFPHSVLEAAKSLPNKVRKTDLKHRQDLRNLFTLTIGHDNALNAQSLHTAFSLQKTEEGHWQLGVHIADVAYYVPSYSPLDQEAIRRGSTVYLGDRIIPILPEAISDHLCALLPDQDRLTISVLITLDESGQVLEFELQPAVIRVDYALTYDHVQSILASEEDRNLPDLLPVFDEVHRYHQVFQALQTQRFLRGAFDVDLPEQLIPQLTLQEPSSPLFASFHALFSRFQYDQEGNAGIILSSRRYYARAIVTELTVLANQLIGSHLSALNLPTIFRVQRSPDLQDVQDLIRLINLVGGMDLDLELKNEDEVLPEDYQRFLRQFANHPKERVLTYLLLNTLKPPAYSRELGDHFGLGISQGYVHATSPVRRYPDLVIQRILHTLFNEGRDRRNARVKETVNLRHQSCHGKINWNVLPPDIHHELDLQISSSLVHLSERDKIGQEAESDLIGLKKAEFMKVHTGGIFQGLITGVQSYGFFVEIETFLVEGLVHVSSLKDDWYEYRSRQQRLVGRKYRRQFCLGDLVEVQVKSVDYYRQQIDLAAVGGGSEGNEDDLDDLSPLDIDPNSSLDSYMPTTERYIRRRR